MTTPGGLTNYTTLTLCLTGTINHNTFKATKIEHLADFNGNIPAVRLLSLCLPNTCTDPHHVICGGAGCLLHQTGVANKVATECLFEENRQSE